MTILYILLFLVCLSLLVMIHEAGHLITAKAFKVYCFEYSFGFGPKLFSRKRKNGETYFSIRAIPFGGFVSMYDGENPEDVPNGLVIDKSRALGSIHKWKRAIILFAGVFMNAILGLLVYFISNSCFTQYQTYINIASIKEESAIYEVIKDDPLFDSENLKFQLFYDIEANEKEEFKNLVYILDTNAQVEFKDEVVPVSCIAAFDLKTSLSGYDKLEWFRFLSFYRYDESGKITNLSDSKIVAGPNVVKANFSIRLAKPTGEVDEKNQPIYISGEPHNIDINVIENNQKYSFEDIGISAYLHSFRYSFGQSFGVTFRDFGDASTAIVRGLGSLFTSNEARESMGGLIAIGFVTSDALANFGFNTFLRLWGMISINLAIINLIPYPGLDGWQLLVLAIEGIFRKEMPKKVKTIVSFVGMIILFAFMIFLLVKDVFKFIIV